VESTGRTGTATADLPNGGTANLGAGTAAHGVANVSAGTAAQGMPNIHTDIDSDGVLVATIDMPGRSMNVFSAGLMDSLEQLLDEVQSNAAIKAVVLCSGKSAFLAGADLEMVRMFTERARTDSPEDLHRLCGRLGRLFRRLETNGKPFVAAIHGLALGGGLEVALACHERVAAEKTEVGLPEIKLGLLPGAGGTQRLPRLIGQFAALKLMLKGDPLPAAKASSLGIIDAVVPLDRLLEHAKSRALARAAGRAAKAPWDIEHWLAPVHPNTEENGQGDLERVFDELGIGEDDRRRYPASEAIMECVVGGWHKSMEDATSWEMDCFVRLIRDPTAGNMIRSLFLDRQRAAKLIPPPPSNQPARAAVHGPGAEAVRALLRASRVEIVDANTPGCVVILTDRVAQPPGTSPESTVRWYQGSGTRDGEPTRGSGAGPRGSSGGGARGSEGAPAVWVSDLTQYGRAIEVITGADGQGKQAGLQIARWLRATPVVSQGASFLGELAAARTSSGQLPEDEKLLAIALAAAKARARDADLDPGIADSAAVVAGLFPAYAGGPFTYLRQHGRNADAD
jgi:3-hydroxyacyl-CoA dehydrogenase / enoyl-CoA hydratase / 3-hydroxybutyryl-CoA epimerase